MSVRGGLKDGPQQSERCARLGSPSDTAAAPEIPRIASFYCCFISNFTEVAPPLTDIKNQGEGPKETKPLLG